MSKELTENIFELTDLYGAAILEDPERMSQFLEDKLPGHENEIFYLVFAVRFLVRNGWRAKSPASKLTPANADDMCAKLGFSEAAAHDVVQIINDAIDHIFGTCERIVAHRGTLQAVPGGLSRPRPMLTNRKSVYNGIILATALFIVCMVFAQINAQRMPVGDELRIAFFAHLSGKGSDKGQTALHAAQLAVETVNSTSAHRDGYKLKVIGLDIPKNKPAADFIKETMQDKSYLAIMLGAGADIRSAAEAADDVEAPLIIVSDVPFDAKELLSDHNPPLYAFSLTADISSRAKLAAYFASQALMKKHAAVYYDSRSAASKESAAAAARWCKRFGMTVTAELSFNSNGKSHASAAEAIAASGSDILILPSVGAEAQDIINDSKQTSESLTTLSENSSAGDWMLNEISVLDPSVISVLRNYKKFYNEECDVKNAAAAIMAYDGVRWLAHAFENAPGFHGEAVRHSLLATRNLPLTHATLTIDPRTHLPMNKAFSLTTGSNGKYVFQRRIRINKQ